MKIDHFPKPSVFSYSDYRQYLADVIAALKQASSAVSYRWLARRIGFASPNFLQLVMLGKRNLSSESIGKLTKALKLPKDEAQFFRTLVLYGQSHHHDEKRQYAEALLASAAHHQLYPLKAAEFEFYATWYCVPIRELVELPEFNEDPQWVADQLIPRITADEAKRALELLVQLGLLIRNKNGRLVQANRLISTGDQVVSTSVVQFHRDMMDRAKESLDRFGGQERQVSSLTLGLSQKGEEKIRGLVDRFRKELLAVAHEDREPQRIVQVNFQVFPLSQRLKEDKD